MTEKVTVTKIVTETKAVAEIVTQTKTLTETVTGKEGKEAPVCIKSFLYLTWFSNEECRMLDKKNRK